MSKSNGAAREPQLLCSVEFGGVSIGEATARLGLRIARPALGLETADRVFVGHRLTVEISLGQRDDAPGQSKMFDADLTVAGVADCKRIGVSPESITTGLTFSLDETAQGEMAAHFTSGTGNKLCMHSNLPRVDQVGRFVGVGAPPPGTCATEPVSCVPPGP